MAGKRKRGAQCGTPYGSFGPKKAKKDTKSSKPNMEKKPFAEIPTGDDRRREADLYEMLGSEDENDRIRAADCIISSLFDGRGVSEAVLQRHLDRRLFRGLASGRNASRIGFCLVITEILGQLFGEKHLSHTNYTGLSFDKVLGLLAEKTQAVGNISGQEERDHFFGQLFGIECFVKSRTLFSDISRWNLVLNLLLKLGNKKIWLRPQCGWVLVQALEQMDQADAEATLSRLAQAGLARTPEGVSAWIVTLNRFPSLRLEPWKNPLSSKSLPDLTAVLKESFKENGMDGNDKSQNGGKQASWSAQLHFVWDLILGRFLHAQRDNAEEDFEQFWNRVVDDGLFSKQATDGQKFKGFMVFQKMLEGFIEEPLKVQTLFSRNFMSCLLNQASKEDRYLHRAAIKALKSIEAVVSAHPSSLAPVLASLIGKNGAYGFDQRTSTKTVDRLLQNITEGDAEAVLTVVQKPVKTLKQKEAADAQSIVRIYADYLAKILNALASSLPADDEDNATKGSFGPVLQELAGLAYAQPKGIPENAVTEQIRETCRSRLESSLAKLARSSKYASRFCEAVGSIDSSAKIMAPEILESLNDALARMGKLLKRKSKTQSEKDAAQGLAMLHAISAFQLYNDDPDAMEVLDDLAQFYDRLHPKKGSKHSGKCQGSSELLVEILLSMVARPSSLMRQVSQQVFEAFSGQVSAEGLELLTGPLASEESTKGQKELFNTEDDAMDVDESEGPDEDADEDEDKEDQVEDVEDNSDFEIDSDMEFVDLHDDAPPSSSDDTSPHRNQGEWNKPEELDDMLGKILNSHRLDKDADAASSSSEGDMSDSQMFALDEHLSAAIAPRIKSSQSEAKKAKKDAKQSVINFKHRILDLLDIYVKNEALNALTYTLLIPLLNLMRTTSAKPLSVRACEIVLAYQRGLRKARASKEAGDDAPGDDLLPLLVQVHEVAGKDNSHAYAKAASAASLIVASSIFASDRSRIRDVAGVYARTQSDWVLGHVTMQSSFFADWNNWCQNHASQSRA
ncbi:DNA polymerase V family protein [Metarhizium album ARSEF 1941]|uniref:DNA polymerase V family protein n=1 Tax=Metarhizium album (strain ARSEF 1941) TaxID=1081103 RepID=A0A0B2WV44_METAS|nr:DNA polymerase V family protein [Metarhizium album ARSEF 1941]KHN99981.1 DNA polymerase V family protein [Metarhizium album ARSEF 1941]